MKTYPVIIAMAVFFAANAKAAPFSWVNGKVTAIVNNTGVRFCDSSTGVNYAVTSDNLFYDLLKTALETKRNVQVGINNFGLDPQAGSPKLCINRVILTGP
jgi:hypothetical protein